MILTVNSQQSTVNSEFTIPMKKEFDIIKFSFLSAIALSLSPPLPFSPSPLLPLNRPTQSI